MCQSLDILSQVNICCQGNDRHGWECFSPQCSKHGESAHCSSPEQKALALLCTGGWGRRKWGGASSGKLLSQGGEKCLNEAPVRHLCLSSSLQLHPENPGVSTVGREFPPTVPISLMTLLVVGPERSRIGSWPGMISNFKLGNNVNRLVLSDLSLWPKCGIDAEGKAEMHGRKSEHLWGPSERDFGLNHTRALDGCWCLLLALGKWTTEVRGESLKGRLILWI